VNDIVYGQKGVSVKTIYSPDQTIDIHYDTSNPNTFVVAAAKWVRPVIGGSLTILAVILILFIWWYYNVYKV
jgi:hypothetical protein